MVHIGSRAGGGREWGLGQCQRGCLSLHPHPCPRYQVSSTLEHGSGAGALRLAEMRQSLNGHVPTVPRDTSALGSHSSSFISWQMGSCPEMWALRDGHLWSLCCVTCPMSGEAQIPTQVVGSTRFQVLPLPHLLAKASPHFDPSHPTRASNPSTHPLSGTLSK